MVTYGNNDIASMERIHKALPKLTTDELLTIMNCINPYNSNIDILYKNADSLQLYKNNITSPRDL